jgi:hypothetical protein
MIPFKPELNAPSPPVPTIQPDTSAAPNVSRIQKQDSKLPAATKKLLTKNYDNQQVEKK